VSPGPKATLRKCVCLTGKERGTSFEKSGEGMDSTVHEVATEKKGPWKKLGRVSDHESQGYGRDWSNGTLGGLCRERESLSKSEG